MAISGFGRGKGGETMDSATTVAAPQKTSSSSSPMGGLTAFIDQGSEFEGKLSFKDTVRIDGSFRGEITSENTLVVGETGEIEATIRSQTVVISGSVVGDIFANKQIVLHKSARVQGDLQTPSVVIEEGAIFNGSMDMKAPDGSGNVKSIKGGQTSAPSTASSESGSDKLSGGAK